MNAPIRRVLPTPVASAKHSDGNSRSKSVTDGNSEWIVERVAWISCSLRGDAISVTRSSISSERCCGGRRLIRPAMGFTSRFNVHLLPLQGKAPAVLFWAGLWEDYQPASCNRPDPTRNELG